MGLRLTANRLLSIEMPAGMRGGSVAHVLALDYGLRPVLQSMGARHIVQSHFIPLCLDYGMPALAAAGVLAMMGGFDFVGTIIAGWLSDRISSRWLLFWFYGLRGIALALLPFSDFTLYGLINAITQSAHEHRASDEWVRAFQIERLAGEILRGDHALPVFDAVFSR